MRERYLAWALAVAMTAVALSFGARGVGGADDYGYVSQAELWLHGPLRADQSFVAEAPFPGAAAAFAPLGYLHDPRDYNVLVPAYAPGLPIVLALVKAIAGQTAMFYVVPICAGLLVLGTYRLGQKLGSGAAGLAGAWLIATSPAVLFMSMLAMTDVPVAAIWTWTFWFLLGESTSSAAGAGLLTGLAVLMRPNLVPLGGIVGLYYVWKLVVGGRPDIRRLLAFSIAALPGPVFVAIFNTYLYGSPTTSGYGNVHDLFVLANVPINFRLYSLWMIQAHTPIVLLGFVALFIPVRAVWPNVRDRTIFVCVDAFVVALWGIYCAWKVFDGWFFCRLLLAAWPWMMLGVGAVAVLLMHEQGRLARVAVVASLVALGVYQVYFARTHLAFEVGRISDRYAVAATLVRQVTTRNAVVLALNHSGSIRYYGGRMTMNIDNFGGWLDEIVEWLNGHQTPVYAALEEWEIPIFRKRFAGARHLAALDRPIVIFENPGRFEIFDLTRFDRVSVPTVVRGMKANWKAPHPVAPPHLVLQ